MLEIAESILNEAPKQAGIVGLDVRSLREAKIFRQPSPEAFEGLTRILALLAVADAEHPDRVGVLEREIVANLNPPSRSPRDRREAT